jgi:hypothetical protein
VWAPVHIALSPQGDELSPRGSWGICALALPEGLTGTVATLTTTNAKLANQLEAANALITQLKSEIATLKNKIKPVWQGQRPARTTNNDSYCWYHGYQVAKSHISATCNVRKTGHQESATKRDTMGGVQWGK